MKKNAIEAIKTTCSNNLIHSVVALANPHNDGLQTVARDQHSSRGKRLLEKHAIAPSAAGFVMRLYLTDSNAVRNPWCAIGALRLASGELD